MATNRVNTKEPFSLVYSLNKHPNLVYLINVNAVQHLPNGNFSLLSQKVHATTAKEFNIPAENIELIKAIDELDPDFIIKRFYKGKKILRQADFFAKYYTPEMHEQVRPFIERRLLKIINQIGNAPLFLAKDKHQTFQKIDLQTEKATVLFHFRRNEEGTNYFATIKLNDEKILFSENGSELIVTETAWLLNGTKLFTFKKNTDGNKIKPFLNKNYILIPPKNEAVYFEKFVSSLIEQYDVYAEGFDIKTEQYVASPILKLNTFFDNKICASLYFKYGPYEFPFHSLKMVSVKLEKTDNDYVFHRVRRSRQWEDIKKKILERIGLKLHEGSLFISEKGENYTLVETLNNNKETLENQGFIIDQSLIKKPYYLGESYINFDVKKQGDWFDLQATVKFGDIEVPFLKLKPYILNGNREFPLPNGTIAIIPAEWLTRYSNIFEFAIIEKNNIKLKRHHVGLLDGMLEEQQIAQTSNIVFNEDADYKLPKGLNATLRPYQITGYKWLRYMHEIGFGACLADDMGLGKTVQILTYLQYISESESDKPKLEKAKSDKQTELKQAKVKQLDVFETLETDNLIENSDLKTVVSVAKTEKELAHTASLVIVPTSLIYNWQNEAQKFSTLKVYVHLGFNRKKNLKDVLPFYDLVITSYGTVRNDMDIFSFIKFHTIILDESQAIKNPNSSTAQSVLKLNSKQRFVITGTPVENSITDLWSQINFLNPGLLGNYHFFNKRYVVAIEKDKNEKDIKSLRNIVKPFILRRTKQQVATDLPLKTEQIHFCNMTDEQSSEYETIKSLFRNELLTAINTQGLNKSQLMILQGLTKLRQIANHPVLANPNYIDGSGKFNEVIEMVNKALENNHKILLFSQFVQNLALFKEYFNTTGQSYLYIDGNTTAAERTKLVADFQGKKKIPIFLISLRAGGVGLNLTEADYVFILDPWWNPAVERQAMDRTHRIGQQKPVFVYKFITKDTVEEKILALQNRKKKVSDDILEVDEKMLSTLQSKDLEELLN